jgi:hypothetical protein
VDVIVKYPYEDEEICLVTIYLETGENLVIWEKTAGVGTESYNVYRETSSSEIYEIIGNVPFDSLSVFLDTTSNPRQQAYRYKLSTVDTCGNESKLSYYHKTILLQVSQGTGVFNLNWSDYEYEGGGFTFTGFTIYRGSDTTSLDSIGSIASSYSSWIDNTPPPGRLYYQIAGQKADLCAPTSKKKTISGPYSQSISNLDDNGIIDGINNKNYFISGLYIYPNPFSDKTTIEFNNPDNESYKLTITDITGKIAKVIDNIMDNKIEVSRNNLSNGYYLIELKGKENIYRGRMVVE